MNSKRLVAIVQVIINEKVSSSGPQPCVGIGTNHYENMRAGVISKSQLSHSLSRKRGKKFVHADEKTIRFLPAILAPRFYLKVPDA
jgi:hypothetical protein